MILPPKISAVVQTYNAAATLDACLSCLHGFDEILVVDMESTDRTREIALRHGARFIVKERGEHRIVEAYRDFAIHAATYDWVLVVDADELIPQALTKFLYSEIQRDGTPRAYLIPIKNYFMGRWMRCYYPDYILRFFYRRGAHWPQEIHSRVIHQGPKVRVPAERTDLAFIHLANESVARTIEKMNNYTDREQERRAPRFRAIKLLYEPPFRFFKTYVLKRGFLDGWPGFIHAVHDAIYRFVTLAKIEQGRLEAKPDSDLKRDVENINRQLSNQ